MIFLRRQTSTGHQPISTADATVVDRRSARIANLIKTTDKPAHEAFVLITAKSLAFKQYVYKLYSNVDEIQFPANWMNAPAIHNELNGLPNKLQEYNHQFHNEGESTFHIPFNKNDGQLEESFTRKKMLAFISNTQQ